MTVPILNLLLLYITVTKGKLLLFKFLILLSHVQTKALIEELGIGLSRKKLKRAMAHLDVDGDGMMAKDDFLRWYTEISQKEAHIQHLAGGLSLFDEFSVAPRRLREGSVKQPCWRHGSTKQPWWRRGGSVAIFLHNFSSNPNPKKKHTFSS